MENKINEMLNSGNYEIKEIHYSSYKYSQEVDANPLTAIQGSYNKETKTIKVLMLKEKNINNLLNEYKEELTNLEKEGKFILTINDIKKMSEDLRKKCKLFNVDSKELAKLTQEYILKNYKLVQNKELKETEFTRIK